MRDDRLDRAAVGLLTASHLVGDVNQGVVGPLVALFVTQYRYSYAAAGSLILGTTIVSTVAQPLLGHLADRVRSAWLLPAGVLLASLGVAGTGLTSRYWLVFGLLSASGLGVATYHPIGARLINRVTPVRRGAAMSVFSVGGALGLAAGSVLLVLVVSGHSLRGTAWLAVPGVATAAVLATQVGRLNGLETAAAGRAEAASGPGRRDAWGRFARLAVVMTGRSVAFYGLTVFVPLEWIVGLHASRFAAGAALTGLLLCGVAGSLIGGRLADSHGPRPVIVAGLGLLAASLCVLGLAPGPVAAWLLLIPLGLGLYAPHSVMVAMGQELIPRHLGMASGLLLGLAVSTGGLAAPVLGRVGDDYGIPAAFGLLAGAAAAATALAVTLPRLRLGAAR
ncbi:MAG TPA: MFS transporter [Streptosporangiaceae bacterium]|jgi:FSR family fosmidomycin resistance protein-like MFS transporter